MVINAGIIITYRLKEPVFMEMYIHEPVYVEEGEAIIEYISLIYITDVSDDRRVIDVKFKDHPNIHTSIARNNSSFFSTFNFNTVEEDQGETYGRYTLHDVMIDIVIDQYEEAEETIELKDAWITFDDGSTRQVDIGSILLYRASKRNDDIDINYSSSSSDGTKIMGGKVTRGIKLLGVDMPTVPEGNEIFTIKVGDKIYTDISGIHYYEHQPIEIIVETKEPQNIVNKYTFYDIRPELSYEKEDGSIASERILNVRYKNRDFNIIDVFKYLKARGAI